MVRRWWVAVIIAIFLALNSGPVAAHGAAHGPHHQHAGAQSQPTFQVLEIALTAPAAPHSLVVHPNGTSIGLTWDAVPGATSYAVYRGTSAQGESSTPYFKGITAPSFTNTKVTKGTVYYYQVTAVNASGESARSNEVFSTPEGIPTPPVSVPGPAQADHVSAMLGWLLGLLFLALAIVAGIFFFRRRGAPAIAPPPPPPLSPGDTVVARGLFDPPTTPVGSWQDYGEPDDNGDTISIVPPDQRQLAPLGDAPIWPTAPLRPSGAYGDRQQSSGSLGLIVAIVLIALGVVGIGLFAYFAATSGNGGNQGLLPAATSTTVAAATIAPTVQPSPTAIPPLAVNAGGGLVGNFTADAFMHGGDTDSTENSIDTSGVDNAAPPAVYQSERWGTFSYVFPNLAPGSSYTVRLHFAEIYFTLPGERMFNVAINGKRVLNNFDIIAEAGAPDRAVVKDFSTTVTGDGKITIRFSDGDANHAKVSGIELIANS